MVEISIIIPTYKRVDSLKKLLKSIEKQTILPQEVIIIASGIENLVLLNLKSNFKLPIIIFLSEPSVCKQRNVGIKYATSKYIQLCDDDIELPENYLKKLSNYLLQNPEVNIVSGEETQLISENNWQKINQKISLSKLYYNYIFGLPFWSDLKENKQFFSPISKAILKQYENKKNSISKSGWPYVNDFSYPIMKTTIYSLQAAMIRSKKLKKNLFDESLSQHGFGDNYDVAIRINGINNQIHILSNTPYKHYKVKSNRLKPEQQYYYRTKALFTFIQDLPFFTPKNRLFFIWSLIGNGILFFLGGKFKYFYKNMKVGIYATKSILK